jgi:hypothetical protein
MALSIGCVKEMGTVADIVMALFAIIASVFAYFAWRASNKQNRLTSNSLKYSILADLFKDYRSIEMGHSIRKLYGTSIRCKSKELEWINYYMMMFKKEKGALDSLHDHRRRVSSFYQYMASLLVNDIISKKLVYSVWKKGDLEIIPKILMPIESIALPKLMKTKELDKANLPEVFENMMNLYKDAPN